MKNRRAFLAVLGAAGAAAAVPASADAPSSPGGSPAPSPSASAVPPSAAALATAEAMRRFDPGLGDAEITTIARAIDDNAKGATSLNPKGRGLRNADEPVVVFDAEPSA